MNKEDAEEYTAALGQVVAGGWRQVALGKRLGVPTALGISTDEWVENRLGGYVRLSVPDRREAVAELTDEGMSTREIGEVLGVANKTVHRDQAVSNDTEPEPVPSAEAPPEPEAVSNDTEPAPAPAPAMTEEMKAEVERAVVADTGGRQSQDTVALDRWESALRQANSAAKAVRALPDFPEGADQLLRPVAREVASALSAAAQVLIEGADSSQTLRRIK